MNKVQEKNFKIIVAIKNHSDFALNEKIECVITLDKSEQIAVYPFQQAIFFNTDHLDKSTSFSLQFRTQKDRIPFGSLPIMIPQNVEEKDEIEIVKQFQFGLPTSDQNLKGSYYIIILNKQVFMDKNSGKQSQIHSQNQKDQVDDKQVSFGNQDAQNREGSRNKSYSTHSSQGNQQYSTQNSASKQRGEKSPSNKRYLQSLKNKSSPQRDPNTKSHNIQGNSNEMSSNAIDPQNSNQIPSSYNSTATSSHKKNPSQPGMNTTPSKASSITQSYLVQNQYIPQRSSSNSRQNLTPTSISAQKPTQQSYQNAGSLSTPNAFEPITQQKEFEIKDGRRLSQENIQARVDQDEKSTPNLKASNLEPQKQGINFKSDKIERYEKIFKYSPPKNHSPYRSILRKENQNSNNNISPLGSAAKEPTSSQYQTPSQQQNQIPSTNNQSIQKSGILTSNNKPIQSSAEKQNIEQQNKIDSAIKSNKNSGQKPNQFGNNIGNSDQKNNNISNSDHYRNPFGGSDTKTNNLPNPPSRYPATSDFDSQINKDKQFYQIPSYEIKDSPLKKRMQSSSPMRQSTNYQDKMSPVRKQSLNSAKKNNLNSTSPLSKSGYLSPAGNGLNFLMNLDGSKRESKHEIETLKMVIYSQDGKLKNLQQTEEMNRYLTEELKRSEESRKELQMVLQRQVEIEVESRTDVERRLNELTRDKKDMHQIILQKNEEISMLARQHDTMAKNMRQLDKDYHDMKISYMHIDDLKHQNIMYREDLNALMGRLRSSTLDFDERFDKLYKDINILEEEKSILNHQKTDLLHEISKLQVDNSNLHQQNLQKQYEIESLLRKLSLQTAYEDGLRINNAQVEALSIQLKEEQRQKSEAKDMIDKFHRQIMDLKHEKENDLARYREDVSLLKKTLEKSQETINEQSDTLTEMSKVNFLNKQENNQNEVKRQVIKDLEDQLDGESKRNVRISAELNEVKKRSYEQCELLSTQNGEISQLKQNIRELTNLVDEGEEYAQSLKQIIFDLREQHSDYIPIKGDPIDSCLASYLNNYNGNKKQARTLFLREGSGVYQFGSKRVYVKIEQGKVLIRTGGGFIGIEEFLDLYTPSELEKYERNDPLKVLSQNYTVNKKLSQAKCVNEIKEMQTVPLQNNSLGPSFSKIK